MQFLNTITEFSQRDIREAKIEGNSLTITTKEIIELFAQYDKRLNQVVKVLSSFLSSKSIEYKGKGICSCLIVST